mgnify:CR=1 FL=1
MIMGQIGLLLKLINRCFMDFKRIRLYSGLTQKEFSRIFNIPLRTIENWESGTRRPPDYVYNLIMFSLSDFDNYKKYFNLK